MYMRLQMQVGAMLALFDPFAGSLCALLPESTKALP